MQMSYWRFAAMIATSTVVMFGLMYINTYALDHVFWSETRAWMALLMGATMAVIMLSFMLAMYSKRALNIGIFIGAAVVFALSLWLVRSQATITGSEYMRAMIPHHSIAVMTSERAQITDPRVRKLADEIIAAQRREIAEMKYLISAQEQAGPDRSADTAEHPVPRVVPASVAITSAEIATIDLAELEQAEVDKVLGGGPRCGFHYSRSAGPVAATETGTAGSGSGRGVVKLHGRLVALEAGTASPMSAAGFVLSAPGVSVTIEPQSEDAAADAGRWREANAVLHLDSGLEVGYGGFLRCGQAQR